MKREPLVGLHDPSGNHFRLGQSPVGRDSIKETPLESPRLAHLTCALSSKGAGVAQVVLSLAQAQRAAGNSVRVFGVTDSAENVRKPGVECHRRLGPAGYAPGLGRALARSDAEVLHLHGLFTWPSQVASTWGAQTGRPVVVAPHGMLEAWALANSAWKKRLFRWLIEDRNLGRAACIHVVSPAEAESVRRLNFRRPIAMVPNGVELPNAHLDLGAQGCPSPKQQGQRVLLFLGRLHPKKGILPLLDAWASLRREGTISEWILRIIGPDQLDHRTEIQARTHALGLDYDVEVLGPVYGDAKATALAAADAFILPSFSEGFSMAVLEAMSHRLPVVITHACNFDVEAFGGGLLCDPTPTSLSERLRALLSLSDHERRAMGERGRAEIEGRYTWEKVAIQIQEVYRWLLDRGPQPACVQL